MSHEEQKEQELQEGQKDNQPKESQENPQENPSQSTPTSYTDPLSGETYEAGENLLDP